MDRIIDNPAEASMASFMSYQVGSEYELRAGTAAVLDNINRRLTEDSKSLRSYRRALAFSKVLEKDLIPILVNSREDSEAFEAALRLLVNLTVPVECLLPIDVLNQTNQGKQTMVELTSALVHTKELFRESATTRVIMEKLSMYANTEKEILPKDISTVENCLLLIRNILHIPESSFPRFRKNWRSTCSSQNQIIWNLFSQNLDKVLLDLIVSKGGDLWCTSIVQLIALVYKDQHVLDLQKLLQNFLESSLSESSEDNESNTSPQDAHEQNGYCSSALNTVDETSEESGGGRGTRGSTSPTTIIPETVPLRVRTDSMCSLEVVPNLSPSVSEASVILEDGVVVPAIEEEDEEEDEEKETTMVMAEAKEDGPKPGFPLCSTTVPVLAITASSVNSAITTITTAPATRHKCDTSSSGVESMSNGETDRPPHKKYIMEAEDGGCHVLNRRSPTSEEAEHKEKNQSGGHFPRSDVTAPPYKAGGSGSESSSTTGIPKKTANPSGNTTDYGYISQQARRTENQESNSTSSNDDDAHWKKPRTNPMKLRAKNVSSIAPQEKRKKHRLKLLKKIQENRMRSKAMINHIPTDQDISELLMEFTLDFLMTGYAGLVEELLRKLTEHDPKMNLDKSHFLWLITYFLKFASQLEVGLDRIGSVLSFATLSYITYEGVELLETMELATREQREDLGPLVRKLHLVVTALREFIQAIASYKLIPCLSPEDKEYLDGLQLQTAYTREIRQLLLLLLRRFNPQFQSQQYLSDLVVCNHMLLQSLENLPSRPDYRGPAFNMMDHIAQFASTELMRQYGSLLEDYDTNSPLVNDCIFTMMHHVAGDLGSPQTLYIPSILKSFSKIWEQGLQICEDWVDLIEYLIQNFIQSMSSSPHKCAANMVECLDNTGGVDECGFTKSQASQLFWHFSQVLNSNDPVGAIIEIYRQKDNVSLSRLAVIQALLSHGIITHAQYMNFMYMKNVMSQFKRENEGSVIAEVGSEHCHSDGHITDTEEGEAREERESHSESEINVLKECLVRQGREGLISWVQEVLLEACRVKMYPTTIIPESSSVPHEPIPFYYNQARQSIPLVPYNRMQHQGLQTEAFILLLHKLGFLLPADVGKVFPRIPYFWSADHLYSVAAKIGPIRPQILKFSPEELERITSRKSTAGGEPMEQEQILITPLARGGHDVDAGMDLLESPSSAAVTSFDRGGGGGGWLQLAMASKMMAFARPERSSTGSSNDTGSTGSEHSSTSEGLRGGNTTYTNLEVISNMDMD